MFSRRQKKIFRIAYLISGSFLLIAALWLMAHSTGRHRIKYIHYTEFGIGIPENYSIHGIDVSHYNDEINWPLVKAMRVDSIILRFAFIKATEGLDQEDEWFEANWKKSKENQIIRGAYHYFITNEDGEKQAQYFIGKVKLEPGDLPPVLDIEDLGNTTPAAMIKELKKFLVILENHYHVKPILYSYADFYDHYLSKDFSNYPFWVAHYGGVHGPRINREFNFWQHNDSGHVNGINSYVDFDVFNGDSAKLSRLLIH
jgi:lysozyme